MIIFTYSCGDGGGGSGSSSESGSVSFGLVLQEPNTSQFLNIRAVTSSTSQFECETDDYVIAAIEAVVCDENGDVLAEGGPFDCEDRQGNIGGVEAGDGRVVKVFAKDEFGEIIAEGQSDPLTIVAGQTVNAGTIILFLNNSAPVADAGPDQTRVVGDTVVLDGSGSSDVDGDFLTFSWSFTTLPAGSEAELSDPTAVNPTFEVDVRDTYVVQLIVNDGSLDSAPDTVRIDTENSAPVADAGPDQTPVVGDRVSLDGSGSSDVDGDLLTYLWSITTLPEGSQATLSDPTAVDPTFVVDVKDIYDLQLIVNDGSLDSDPDSVRINTQNSAPVADAGPDQTRAVGDTVTLDGSGSSDVDGDLLTYLWSFTVLPDGSEASLSDPTAVNPTFFVDVRDTYVVQLIVDDGTVRSDPDTVRINTQNSAPVANAGPDQTPVVGDTVTLDGSGSSDVDGDLLTYLWSFTTLPEGSQATLSDPTAVDPTFVVDVKDTYDVQLIVNDGSLDSDPDSVRINTQNSAPVADAGPDQTRAVGDTVTLDGSGSSDVDGDPLTYFWSFTVLPDGSEASLSDPTAVNPTFFVDVRDTYVVQLIVDDGTVRSDPDTVSINVQNSPPVIDPIVPNPKTVFEFNTLQFTISASDPDGDPLNFPQPIDLPDGASFRDNGDNTATFTWETGYGDSFDSPYTVTFQVFDNQSPPLSDSEEVTIEVEFGEFG